MNKKRRWLLILLITAIVLSIINYYITSQKKIVFSDEPKDWVKQKENIKEIKPELVSKGKSYMDNLGQQYNDYEKGIRTSFKQEGFYKGKHFLKSYSENNKEIMRITNQVNPEDGVIEGYMLEVIEDEPVVYIFLDQDWKENVRETNIFWGINFEKQKTFEFKEISKGVYMDKITDDVNRFSNNFTIHTWGVIVGDITREDDVNKTLIKLV